MSAGPSILVLLVGAALIAAPWWSSTLRATDYPLVIVLGSVFAAFGAYASLPERFPRLRTLVFCIGTAAFGAACAALALSPLAPSADGTYAIGGIEGFRADVPMPWWARIVAGFFAAVLLPVAALGLWGLLRELLGRQGQDGDRSPQDGST